MRLLPSAGVFVLLAGLAPAALASAPRDAPAPTGAAETTVDPEVVTVEAIHAVVLPMKGSYLQHPEAFNRLGGLLSEKGITPTGPAFGRYFSDPSVGEANLVWEIGFPVPEGMAVEAPYEIRDLPETLVAVFVHHGPMDQIGQSWGRLIEWVLSNGYQPVGPAMQVFKGDMMASPEMELRLPVAR